MKKEIKRKNKKLFYCLSLVVVALILIAVFYLSIKGNSKSVYSPNSEIDGIAENVLRAIDSENYIEFIRYLSPETRTIFSENLFNVTRNLLINSSGNYISKVYNRTVFQDEYEVYIYLADYSKEQVKVTIAFIKDKTDIVGFWVDSDNLREYLKNQ